MYINVESEREREKIEPTLFCLSFLELKNEKLQYFRESLLSSYYFFFPTKISRLMNELIPGQTF